MPSSGAWECFSNKRLFLIPHSIHRVFPQAFPAQNGLEAGKTGLKGQPPLVGREVSKDPLAALCTPHFPA